MKIEDIDRLMTKFTKDIQAQDGEEVKKFYIEYESCQSDFMHTEVDYWSSEQKERFKEITGLETDFQCIDRYGGCDKGSDFWSIYKINDKYVKFIGWYVSHHGADYEDMRFVEPVEEVVTIWK